MYTKTIIKIHYLHFIEKIIEEDIKNGLSRKKIKFRFPPEPNGFLHIGHVKAICLNFELGKKYNAPVYLRFDDTNPTGENNDFIESIKKDISFLGFKWDKECYASDYFEILYNWAIKLIKNNKAYVDDSPKNIIQLHRSSFIKDGIDSPNRTRSIHENIHLFEKMKNGSFQEGHCVLRAKINMHSSNINMRDPIMYRISYKKHYKTGNEWCIYPTYNWAHGQCDYIEQISHSLCSIEFVSKNPLYNWFIDQVHTQKNIKPKQIEFSRLNLNNAITSKRKINILIKKNIIRSWDDPRLSTISGLKKKGYTSIAIKNFIHQIGITKRNNFIQFSLLEFYIRNHLNKISPRMMVVLNPIKLTIDNYPENKIEWIKVINNPKKLDDGYRLIPFSKNLYIESKDFIEHKKNNFFRLYIGNEVRLKNAYIVKANYVVKKNDGKIKEIHCTYRKEKENKNKKNNKIKSTIHWISVQHFIPIKINFYSSFSLKEIENIRNFDSNTIEYLNKNSKEENIGYAEPFIKKLKVGSHVQFQRIGYFYLEKIVNNMFIFNHTISMRKK